ncbi:MAG: chemotaxis family two-component system response regulator Rcp1 [bacterium]
MPVIMLTSSEADIDIYKSYEYNASSYIVKPVNADKFKKVVEAIEDFWFSVVALPDLK